VIIAYNILSNIILQDMWLQSHNTKEYKKTEIMILESMTTVYYSYSSIYSLE